MLLSYFICALLPLAAVASPATTKAVTTTSAVTTPKTTTTTSSAKSSTTSPNLYADFCSAENTIITLLKATSTATAFCSSYLSITTKTFSTTSTITPAQITTSTTVTAPVTYTTVTVSTTTTVTNTATAYSTSTTTTTSASTIAPTCLSAASSAPTKRAVRKRGSSSIATPSCIPSTWASTLVSSACSCLNIPTPSTTLTSTTTLVPVTITNTITTTPTSTVTTTATITSIVSTTTTSTVTATATATAIVNGTPVFNGVAYKQYFDTDDAGDYEPNFPVSELKSQSPNHIGTTGEVVFNTARNGPPFYLTMGDGFTFDCTQGAVVMQGYFVAPETSSYTFYTGGSNTDNWNILWVGDNAYTWQDGQYAYEASRTAGPSSYVSGQATFTFNAGDAVPMTFLFANGGGPGSSYYIFESNNYEGDPSQFLVQPCSNSPFQ